CNKLLFIHVSHSIAGNSLRFVHGRVSSLSRIVDSFVANMSSCVLGSMPLVKEIMTPGAPFQDCAGPQYLIY
ncbi:MAG: hypothetical protein K6T68_11300, partial [Alicyclobacillus shizuokensis]|nr:hypothetical protein [Alicyclobacillus shizuokensis]